MESILFEKQEASLCAQHALNMLLQGSYFNAVDLAEIAHEMDSRESSVMGGANPQSHNVDDSGYFSVQVMSEALRVFNLELIPLNSPRAARYRTDPTVGRAYICNLNEHWFAVRRFGFQWFTLNSLLSTPRLISDTYLNLFFAQLTNDGYSIFVVEGELPECKADKELTQCPVDPALATRSQPIREDQQDDPDLARAIALSLSQENPGTQELDSDMRAAIVKSRQLDEENDHSLQQALRESMKEAAASRYVDTDDDDEEMDRQLQRALQMSLEASTPPSRDSSQPSTSKFVRTGSDIGYVLPPPPAPSPASMCEEPGTMAATEPRLTIAEALAAAVAQASASTSAEASASATTTAGSGASAAEASTTTIVAPDAAQVRMQRERFLQRFERRD